MRVTMDSPAGSPPCAPMRGSSRSCLAEQLLRATPDLGPPLYEIPSAAILLHLYRKANRRPWWRRWHREEATDGRD